MERVTGIGPAYRAWEASVLPLNYTRSTTYYLIKSHAFNYVISTGTFYH